MATFESSLKSKLIYVFAINDERHRDCLKIGETTIDEDDGSDLFNNAGALQEAAHKRILCRRLPISASANTRRRQA